MCCVCQKRHRRWPSLPSLSGLLVCVFTSQLRNPLQLFDVVSREKELGNFSVTSQTETVKETTGQPVDRDCRQEKDGSPHLDAGGPPTDALTFEKFRLRLQQRAEELRR